MYIYTHVYIYIYMIQFWPPRSANLQFASKSLCNLPTYNKIFLLIPASFIIDPHSSDHKIPIFTSPVQGIFQKGIKSAG